MKVKLLLVLTGILISMFSYSQLPRLVAASIYGNNNTPGTVYQFDTTIYYYSGTRGGDLNSAEIKFDSTVYLQWNYDTSYNEQACRKMLKTFDAENNTVSIKSLQLQNGVWVASGLQTYAYDNQNRVIKEVSLLIDHSIVGVNDTIGTVRYTYTNSGKTATKQVIRYQNNLPAAIDNYVYSYNSNDSLVFTQGPNYTFEWVYNSQNKLTAYLQNTPSGITENRYSYYPNGYLKYSTYFDSQFNFSRDSTFYRYSANYDTAFITTYNLVNGAVRERVNVFDGNRNVLVSIALAGADSLANDEMRRWTYNTQNLALTDTIFFKSRVTGFYEPQQYQIFTYNTASLITSAGVFYILDDTVVNSTMMEYAYNSYNQLTEIDLYYAPLNVWIIESRQFWYYEAMPTEVNEAGLATTDISVFPNPANGNVFIDLPGTTFFTVSVYEVTGRQVALLKKQSGLTPLKLPHGSASYLLTITDNFQNNITKLIINH